MANLIEGHLGSKGKKEYKGDLANNKVLQGSKYGLGPARYRMIIDSPVAGVEGVYFYIIRLMADKPPYGLDYSPDVGVGRIEKIKDVYTAGETSSYWGLSEQRKGLQQDKFQQLMANVGQLLKTLFQLVREIRIIEERLEYYDKTYAGDKNAEVALKSIWVDLVEGGSKNPASVLGLGSQVGFVTLPDLFFSIHPKDQENVEKEVNKLSAGGFNRKVREVLGRKLTQYLIWREKTYAELKKGESFKLAYLRQHYHVIRLYLNWLRPYLRNVQRLQMQETKDDENIIASFETSKIELEVLGVKTKYEADGLYGKETKEFQRFFPVVRVRINYVAMPEIAYQSEGQRGAIHRGRTTVVIESFVAERKKDGDKIIKDDIEEYKGKVDEEDMELLAAVNESILALKDDLERLLTKAGERKKEEETEKKEKPETIFSPFKHLFSGAKDLIGLPSKRTEKKGKDFSAEKKAAEGIAKLDAYIIYNIYKKTHGMLAE